MKPHIIVDKNYDEVISKLKELSGDDLKNYIMNNKVQISRLLLNQTMPKEVLDKLMTKDTFELIFSFIDKPALFRNVDLLNIIASYGLSNIIHSFVSTHNIFDMLDWVSNSKKAIYKLLSIYLLEERYLLNENEINQIYDELIAYPDIRSYVEYLTGIFSFIPESVLLNIINSRFNTNYTHISQILNETPLNINVVKFLLRFDIAYAYGVHNSFLNIERKLMPFSSKAFGKDCDCLTFYADRYHFDAIVSQRPSQGYIIGGVYVGPKVKKRILLDFDLVIRDVQYESIKLKINDTQVEVFKGELDTHFTIDPKDYDFDEVKKIVFIFSIHRPNSENSLTAIKNFKILKKD